MKRDPASRRELVAWIDEAGQPIRQSLGQHYLIDKNILTKISENVCTHIHPLPDRANHQASSTPTPAVINFVIELGCGLGALTQALLAKNLNVLAIETDRSSLKLVRENLNTDAVTLTETTHQFTTSITSSPPLKPKPKLMLLHEDAEKVHWKSLVNTLIETSPNNDSPNTPHRTLSFTGNLPYNIAQSLILSILEATVNQPIESLIFMLQREVAQRLLTPTDNDQTAHRNRKQTKKNPWVLTRHSAMKSNHSAVSHLMSWHAQLKSLIRVPPSCFYPCPQVNSEVLMFFPRKQMREEQSLYPYYKYIIRAGFSHRRKTLLNAVSLYHKQIAQVAEMKKKHPASLTELPHLRMTKMLTQVLKEHDLGEEIRAEVLTGSAYKKIATFLMKQSQEMM